MNSSDDGRVPAYELKLNAVGQWMFNLLAKNGEVILTSEGYNSKASAKKGIAACKIHSPVDKSYHRNAHHFVLRSTNSEIIGTSELYGTVTSMEVGIESCKKNGPIAEIVDPMKTCVGQAVEGHAGVGGPRCGAPVTHASTLGESFCPRCAEAYVDAFMDETTILGMVARALCKREGVPFPTREQIRAHKLIPIQ